MNTTYCNITKQLYSAEGELLKPDEHGIVTVIIESVSKRYILEKLLAYIQEYGSFPGKKKLKLAKIEKPVEIKEKRKRAPNGSRTQRTCIKVLNRKQGPLPIKVLAIDAEGKTFGSFDSMKDAAAGTGVSKASVSKCVNGKAKWNVKGLIFQKVQNQQTA
jgi:hypothetical protein